MIVDNVYYLTQGLAHVEGLKQKQFTKSDFVQLDLVEVPESSLFSSVLVSFDVFLLDRDNSLVRLGAFEEQVVALVNFQEVVSLQGVDHSVHAS